MAILGKPLDKMTEADVQTFAENGVSESRTLDYKLALPGGGDSDKKEFLADVTALANADGGHILFGIAEAGGIPESVPGIESDDVDAEILRLDGSIRSGVDPRIPNVGLKAVALENGRHVVVLEVPPSFARPHMVTFKGTNRFYLRHMAGKAPMTVDEIRTAFSLSDSVIDRVRRFRSERLEAIRKGQAPFSISASPRAVLHLLPLAMNDPAHRFDVVGDPNRGYLAPFGYLDGNFRVNFDGFASYWPPNDQATSGYTQIYHNGAIEAVTAMPFDMMPGASRWFHPNLFEAELQKKAADYLSRQRDLGVQTPILAGVSLLNVSRYRISDSYARSFEPEPFDRADLVVPEVVIDDYSIDPMQVLRPAVDALWNAGGREGSPNYSEDGTWSKPRR